MVAQPDTDAQMIRPDGFAILAPPIVQPWLMRLVRR